MVASGMSFRIVGLSSLAATAGLAGFHHHGVIGAVWCLGIFGAVCIVIGAVMYFNE